VAETVSTNQFKNGMHVALDGQVWRIVEFQHVKPGKGGAFVRTRLKNFESGAVVDRTFRAGERMRYFDLGCSAFGLGGSLWPGHTAAWSPDGTWLALGGSTELTFYELDGDEEVTWPIGAVQITWRRS